MRQAVTECHQGLSLYEGKLFKYKDGLYDELGRLYYMLEQYDSCMFYSEKRLEFLEQIHFKIIPNKVNSDNYYRLYKSYEALGDKDNALKCAHHYIEMQQNMEDNPQGASGGFMANQPLPQEQGNRDAETRRNLSQITVRL